MAKFSMLENIIKMDKKEMVRLAKKAGKAGHKPWLFTFVDIVWCGLKYQTAPVEYWVFKFYEIPRKYRKTYYSRGKNNKIVRALNDPKYNAYFDSKILFNETFAKYVDREWMATEGLTYDVFKAFCERHDVFVAKPNKDTCGKGVMKYKTAEIDTEAVYKDIMAGDFGLIEEGIVQHPVISTIYPGSVNTIRFLMIVKNGVKHFVYCVIRMGHNGMWVDNFDNGGMSAQIDLETGEIVTKAVDGENINYEKHPYTGGAITGTVIPFFDECKKMVVEACDVVPGTRYIGWDVCVTERGPQLIEGNRYPGSLVYPDFSEDKRGFLPQVKEIMGDEWEKTGIKL